MLVYFNIKVLFTNLLTIFMLYNANNNSYYKCFPFKSNGFIVILYNEFSIVNYINNIK